MTGPAETPMSAPPGGMRRLRISVLGALILAAVLGTLALAVAGSRGESGWLTWLMLALLALLGTLVLVLLARSLSDRAQLMHLSQMMGNRARTDWLTGINNRRALNEHLTRATAYARRHGEPVSVMLIDIDGFREANDRFGHEAGDDTLCAVAECMRDGLRTDDVFGRWGGDEFLIILPAIDEVAVRIAARRLCDAATRLDLGEIGAGQRVELSIGTATGVHTSPDILLHAADLDLYQAKAAKRAARLPTVAS